MVTRAVGSSAQLAERRARADHGYYREALELADKLRMRPLVAHCRLGLGKLYGSTGTSEEMQEHLTTATAMYREMGLTYWLGQAEAERRRL